ncbi:hypothetical protein KI387_017618, partial [Taxus chinensis]
MIRVMCEELKTKDVEKTGLIQEKEFTQKKNEVFISIAEEIGDKVIKVRPHLEAK